MFACSSPQPSFAIRMAPWRPRDAALRRHQCYARPSTNSMSSLLSYFPDSSVAIFFRLVAILIVVLVVNRLLRLITNLLIKPAGSEARAAKAREQQTRTVAVVLYSAGSKIVWVVALLTAAGQFGINVTPVATLAGLASLAVGFGAQNLVRDIITGFYIVLEDQYVVGDTIQVGDSIGRVEHVTLCRTVLRDARGALVTIANGDIRTVANLSRDWSQAFVDVSLAPDAPLEQTLRSLESAAAELRADPAWSKTLVDGPRILGVQSFDRNATTVRLQVRTLPNHQDEISRELRRRIHVELQRQGIPVSIVQRFEFAGAIPASEPVKAGDLTNQ